jgi:4a-hydroxytetrahydrobiopterin dehydratase
VAELARRCVPCEGGIAALDRSAAQSLSAHVPGWELDFPRLRRRYRFANFREALAWVNRVGTLAEEEQHHPDFHITGWNQVELVLWTHAVDGLSENDFVLARRIDELQTSGSS